MTVKKSYEFDPKNDLLGTGGFGKVYRARDVNLDIEVAIKKYTGNLPSKYSLFEEIKRVIELNHPNLVRYYDAFELEESSAFGDKIQVGVMEYINGGDFMDFLRKKPSKEVLEQIFMGIMYGLQYLHQHGIIHRDLKPENILIQEEEGKLTPKIVDFGISKVLDDSGGGKASSIVIGSIEYMAPEQFNTFKYGIRNKLNTNLDLWSLGSIMYEAFTGKAPFGKTQEGISRDEIMRNILEKDLSQLHEIPQPFQEVIERCLVRDAKKRARNVDELFNIIFNKSKSTENLSGITPVNSFETAVLNVAMPAKESKETTQKQDTPSFTTPSSNPKGVKQEKQQETSLKWNYLVPIVTAIAGYSVYESKQSIFGWETPLADYIVYPTIFCVALLLVNVFALMLQKIKNFEWSTYLFSFLVLSYHAGEGLILSQYEKLDLEKTAMNFDFSGHSYPKYFPLIGLVIVTLNILARFRINLHWTEMFFNALSYFFLFLLLRHAWLSGNTLWIAAGIVVAVCLFLALWLRDRGKQ